MSGATKKTGRPPKYATERELLEAVAKYFIECVEKKWAPNKAGLSVSLDVSRETYNQYRQRFPDAIKMADNVIEDWWVNRLSGTAATGAIFYLKNAFSEHFRDQQDITSGGMPISTLTASDRKSITELRDLLKQPNAQ